MVEAVVEFYPENPRYEEDGVPARYSPVSIIFQSLGMASMAWAETPKGIFDAEACKDIGDALILKLAELGFDLRETPPPMSLLQGQRCRLCSGQGKMLNSNDRPITDPELICGQCGGHGVIFAYRDTPLPARTIEDTPSV